MTETDLHSLAQKAVLLYTASGRTFSLAESCTGGLVSKLITDIGGASAVYPGGICSYSNAVKERLLGVRAQTLLAHGAVSEQTAREMAEGIRRVMGTDIGIGITGIAGPSSDGTDKPVGLIYLACADESGVTVRRLMNRYTEDIRNQNRLNAAKTALELLLEKETI